ncbi:MAG: glycosyltransferase family 4 protein [bacterium]
MRRIAIIGHMHVNPDNRELFELLMETDEVKFLYPKEWTGSFGEKYNDPEGFDAVKIPFLKNSYIPFFKSNEKYDILWIDEEPYYPQTYFIMKHFADTPVKIVRTAQNLIKKSFFRNRLNNFVNSKANEIVAVGRSSAETVKKIYNRESAHIIPLCVPDRFFDAYKNRTDSENLIRIGIASRIEECKGTRWLLKALEQIEKPYKLLICGEGKDKNNFIRSLDAKKINFEYRGLIPHMEMDAFFREIDIFLNLSVSNKNWTEQQGRSLLEAMASGCAVISSDAGELLFTLDDEGALVKENDERELSEKLNQLLSDRVLIASLAEKQRKRAFSYSKTEIFKKLIEVLKAQ